MSWEQVKHYIAQGAINVTEGKTMGETGMGCIIEDNSLIHLAMISFCEYVQTAAGRVQIRADLDAMDREQGVR